MLYRHAVAQDRKKQWYGLKNEARVEATELVKGKLQNINEIEDALKGEGEENNRGRHNYHHYY